jgi:hypothetical protein
MGYLDDAINPKLDPIILHKRMLAENLKFQNEQIKEKLLNDPTATDHILARLSRSAMTDKAAAKMPEGASFEKALSGIDPGDPRRAMLAKLSTDMPSIIKSSGYGENPASTIMKAVQDRGTVSKEDIYKFVQSRSGFFDKSVAPVADEADYAEWEKKNPGWTSPLASFAGGAAGELAAVPLLKYGANTGKLATVARGLGSILSMAPPVGPGLPAKLIGAGLMTAAAMAGIDAIKKGAASAGSPLSMGEELLASLPVFGGVNALAKMGGKAVRGSLASMRSGLGATEDYAGTNAINTFTRNQEGILRPNAPVGREELKAINDLQILKQGELEAQTAKMESFKKLTLEDNEAILRGANPTEVMNARVKANMEQDIIDTAAKKKILDDRIMEESAWMREADSKLDSESSINRAKRMINPSAVEQAADLKVLKDAGWGDDVITAANPEQRARNAEAVIRHGSFEKQRMGKMVPQVRETFEGMLPQPVKADTIRVTPFKIAGGAPGVIRAGLPERLAIDTGTVDPTKMNISTKTWESTLASRKDAGARKLEAAKGSVASEIISAVPTKSQNVTAFSRGAANIILRAEETGKAIVDAAKSPKEKITTLNMLATQMWDETRQLAIDHKLSGTTHDLLLQKTVTEMGRRFKGIKDEEVLKQLADEEMFSLTSGLTPESSPETHAALQKSSSYYKKMRSFALKEVKRANDGVVPTKADFDKPSVMDVVNKFKPFLLGVTGAAALVPVSSLFGGNEAQAASIPEAVGRSILPSMAKMIQDSGKPVEQMVGKMFEAGHGSPVLSENGHEIIQLMKGYSYAPSDVRVFPKTSIMGNLDNILSPHTRGEIHFDARGANGERLPHSAAVELADRSQVVAANSEAAIGAVKTILKDAGIEAQLSEVMAATQPLVDKYHSTVNLFAPYYGARIQMMDDVLAGKYRSAADSGMTNLSKQLKFVGKDVSKLDPEDQAYYQTIVGEKQKMVDELSKLKPTIDEFSKEHDVLMRDLASKYPTSRVALAVDGTGMGDADPWLKNMLSLAEKKAAEEIAGINRVFAVRMQETGHQIIGGNYMHHPAHPSVDFSKSLEELSKVAPDGNEAMRLINFFHRTTGSKLMVPETAYIMAKYIPDATKRIEISDFWKAGKEGGWDQVRQQMKATGGYDGALKLLDDLRTAFDPMDTGTAGKWLNRYQAFEVARLLTLSPSVSFKHALKLMGNWTIFPSGISGKATVENFGLVPRQIAHDLAGETFKGKNFTADLGKAYTNQSHIYAAVSDMAPYDLPTSSYDRFISKWNQVGSAAVNGVERWDRGQTFLSAMLMASKRGMTPEQARYSLMDSVLKVNFLTGPNNPKWLKDPFIRTMMLFQGTPFKILEQRAMLAYQGGKDIKNTGLELLRQLRADVKAGEERFKFSLLKDEFDRHKDVYGNAYATQFMKQLMVIGTVITTGKMAFDANLWGHVMHIPGTKLNDKGVELGLNPVVGAAYKTASGGNISTDNPDEFWMSRFINSWLTQTGFPAIANKTVRLKDDDIPAMYKDSKLSYLFGVPKTKEK